MIKNYLGIRQYLLFNAISATLVVGFAYVQYNIVLKTTDHWFDYIIPCIVGFIFGTLISRNQLLVKSLKKERNTVLEKNKKIHLYVGTIVHDLKNPVSAIHGLSNLLCEKSESLEENQKKYLSLIRRSSSDILENIGLILDRTKLESGVKPDQLEIGNPYYTIQSTIDKYLIEAIHKSITIQAVIDKNLPNVEYDKKYLDRIISNLISNAIKYSPPHTQVDIYTELLADRLKLIVKDEGLGMSEEDLSNAFQDFKRLSAQPTGDETSTGLGLSIVKQLVEQLGGEIIAESEGKNKGSSFQVTLKISRDSQMN